MGAGPDRPAPLRFLHWPLEDWRLASIRGMDSDAIIHSLRPGVRGALIVRADGLIMQGNHRIAVLRERGIDVDALPREPHVPRE